MFVIIVKFSYIYVR